MITVLVSVVSFFEPFGNALIILLHLGPPSSFTFVVFKTPVIIYLSEPGSQHSKASWLLYLSFSSVLHLPEGLREVERKLLGNNLYIIFLKLVFHIALKVSCCFKIYLINLKQKFCMKKVFQLVTSKIKLNLH